MADTAVTVITVQGEAHARRTAERAIVSLTATSDGPDRDPVVDAVAAAAATITGLLASDLDPIAGAVVRWSADRAHVWSDRPWNQQGEQLPLVFHATIAITAEFADVEALSRFVETASRTEHVAVGTIAWELTDATRLELETSVRAEAVLAAVEKARQFAAAIGLATVSPIAIADPGMLGDGGSGGAQGRFASPMMARAGMDSATAFDFTPGEITVVAAVDARFTAS
jgi:hypothetical protein